MDKSSKIFIAGHKGLVGSAILHKFQSEGYQNIITRTHLELDLTKQDLVEKFPLCVPDRYNLLQMLVSKSQQFGLGNL